MQPTAIFDGKVKALLVLQQETCTIEEVVYTGTGLVVMAAC